MSKFANGRTRSKNAREIYVEQLSHGRGMNKKRETFTSLNSTDNIDFAYRSTPSYLRQLAEQGRISPTEMITAQNVPRTKSASELTPRNNSNRSMSGHPKYKAQEDYYDEIQALKKDMKTIKDENSNLRAKIRRLEEDNTRKRKEIDSLYDLNKDGDLRRTLSGSTTDRNNNNNNNASNTANVVMSLKQRLFKLELQLKQKETAIDELKSDPRWTKSTELELQNRALLGEVERQKVERLNHIQKYDYVGSVDEEKKNAVRKLTREKDELKQENESLKRKVRELEKSGHHESLSVRPSVDDDNNERELLKKTEDLKQMKHELNQAHKDLKQTQHELEQVQEKLEQATENLTRMKHEKSKQSDVDVEDIKHERDQFHEKFNRVNKDLNEIKHERDQYKRQLDQMNEKFEEIKHERDLYKKQLDTANEKLKTIQSGRSSPVPISAKRPQSPKDDKTSIHSSTNIGRRDINLLDDFPETKPKSRPSSPLSSKSNIRDDIHKNRPSSPNIVNESAVKNVQASLRGYLNRSEINKPSDQRIDPRPSSKVHSPSLSSAQLDKSGGSKLKPRDEPNKSNSDNRTSATHFEKGGGSKPNSRDQSLNKSNSEDRVSTSPKLNQSISSLTGNRRSPSTFDSGGGSKHNINDERGKAVSPGPSARKSPTNSKKSIKGPPSDDDDDIVIS